MGGILRCLTVTPIVSPTQHLTLTMSFIPVGPTEYGFFDCTSQLDATICSVKAACAESTNQRGNDMPANYWECDEFTQAYVDCALWSTNDESNEQGGNPLDDNYGPEDIDPTTLREMIRDCALFQAHESARIVGNPEMAGHDFWLTRNGHGAGFWDGDWPKEIGEHLTNVCKVWDEVSLSVGENGLIHA